MLPYGRQQIDADDIAEVVKALKADLLTTGPYIKKFEAALCDVTGAQYAVACSNGTAALHLACMAINLQQGDCAIVPSVTFLATANAVRYCGAEIQFCDVDSETGLMTPETFQDAIHAAQAKGFKIRAALPVHLAGRPAHLAEIKKIADRNDITIIADACHALGGEYKQTPIGACNYETLSTFSFHPVKTIATGEGGAITTNDDALAQHMQRMRHHNMSKRDDMLSWEYEMTAPGYNYRITDIQCALGVSQLSKIHHFVEKRAELVALYNDMLQNISPCIKTHKQTPAEEKISWHLYSARIDFEKLGITRQSFIQQLKDKNIGTQVHYIPVHTQPYYKNLYPQTSLPGAQEYYSKTLSLPLYPAMTRQDVEYVANAIKQIIGNQ